MAITASDIPDSPPPPWSSPIHVSKSVPVASQSRQSMSIPHVLHQVRSPPRKAAVLADPVLPSVRRGRRPRLFGFTELPESSSSSAASSRNASPAASLQGSPFGSRQTSPERKHITISPLPVIEIDSIPSPASSTSTIVVESSSSYQIIPRRMPQRVRSEASLQPQHRVQPASRRRENGLKLDFSGIIPVAQPQGIRSAVIPSPYANRLIRKKSGEIVRSALKQTGPMQSDGTPTREPSPERTRFASKSLPATPSCPKYVHFDARLERVKLFREDQKPQVVSRDGSPTMEYTTSEGEEFPFPSTDEEKESKVLQIKLPNFPSSHPPDSSCYLESLFLDDDRKALKGIVLCKNIAFNKWVAVRFTFDWWQTTSEVTATYKESVRGGTYDRFSFQVKLQDLMSRIEEKMLFLAVRYNTDGNEFWDSNGGQNYQVMFEKAIPAPRRTRGARDQPMIQPGMGRAIGGKHSAWSDRHDSDRMADLRAKLSSLKADDPNISPPQLSPRHGTFPGLHSPRRNFSEMGGSPRRTFSDLETARPSELPPSGPSLAARYDFGTALRNARRSSNSPQGRNVDLPGVRTGLLNFGADMQKRNGGSEAGASPRFSPRKLPEPLSDVFDSQPSPAQSRSASMSNLAEPTPTKAIFADGPTFTSPDNLSTPTIHNPLIVPDLFVQGPSPPPANAESSRPLIQRTMSSPAKLTRVLGLEPIDRPAAMINVAVIPNASAETGLELEKQTSRESTSDVSPPQLSSGSATDTPPMDSPMSPFDDFPKWSGTRASTGEKGSDEELKRFIEQ